MLLNQIYIKHIRYIHFLFISEIVCVPHKIVQSLSEEGISEVQPDQVSQFVD